MAPTFCFGCKDPTKHDAKGGSLEDPGNDVYDQYRRFSLLTIKLLELNPQPVRWLAWDIPQRVY